MAERRIAEDGEDRCAFTGSSDQQCLYVEGHDAHLIDQMGGRAVVVPLWAEWPAYHRAEVAPVPLGIDPAKREEMLEGMRKEMAREMRGVMGDGYVADYYRELAGGFVAIAEHLADEVARGDWS
jgi:hypothetical protein